CNMDRWTTPTIQQSQICHIDLSKESNRSAYNTIDENGAKEYEDPDYLYDQKTLNRRSTTVPSVPVAPPMALRGTLRPTHLAIHQPAESSSWRNMGMAIGMAAVIVLMVLFLISFLLMGSRAQAYFHPSDSQPSPDHYPTADDQSASRDQLEITPNHLLTLLLTKRKLCLFEASTENVEHSLASFNEEHIESARLLFHSNLSHASVPVHPLQFQRYTRSLGVDDNCHVIIYDRGQTIWATYAVWIFKLFGHKRVSLLAGGLPGWKEAHSKSPQYRTENGPAPPVNRQGDFSSSWNEKYVITFDDVFVNTEMASFDVVDAQEREEYEGTSSGALYGHIRGATNIPIDRVFDYAIGRWYPSSDLTQVFHRGGLSPSRPVIVYCSTSVRSSLIWFSLLTQNYDARIYFGGWPEWVVRAPDYLKILASSPN
ncbi:hypothetical protein PMAYCL1PPCAC_29328, partial [Pristionchus mayeri]